MSFLLNNLISHAIFQHGNERMSQVMVTQGLGVAGDLLTSGNSKVNSIFNGVFGPGSQVAYTLPNSRNQE